MRTLQTAFIFAVSLSAAAAYAQTAGDATRGNTPPGMSQDGAKPADGALKGGSILPGEAAGVPNKDSNTAATERLKRCDELNGMLREQCLDKERAAAVGATSEPRERDKQDKLAPD